MKINETFFYIAVLIASAVFLVLGNRLAAGGQESPGDEFAPSYYRGVVTRIIDRFEDEHLLGEDFWVTNTTIVFSVRLAGERRGEEVIAEQHLSTMFVVVEREVDAGDRVILFYDDFGGQFFFANHVRITSVAVLGVVFLALVILFGRKKGLKAIVALGFICLAVFLVFIPAILSGRNIYAAAIIICAYAIASTLLMVIGPNKKALSAMLGCLGGVLLAALLMLGMDAALRLTGVLDHETQALLFLDNPIDLRALIFAGVVLGAVGAIMDVAMSIASSLWELKQAGGSDFAGLVKSGVNIGRDILGTMLNTLILAYIGSSLSLILLITAHATSMAELFNMEMIIVEFLRALVGSFGMLLTIPLTAGICGWLYSKKNC